MYIYIICTLKSTSLYNNECLPVQRWCTEKFCDKQRAWTCAKSLWGCCQNSLEKYRIHTMFYKYEYLCE